MGISRKFRKRVRQQFSFIKRRLVKPPFPKNNDGKVLIHIGCGEQNSPEYINIDARPFPHVHIVTNDITSLPEFTDSSVDLIYMCHMLEHIKEDELKSVLIEMKRTLKKGGVLRISVPDFDRIIEIYKGTDNDIDSIKHSLMGGQDHEYNIHFSVFNRDYLTRAFKEAGFQEVRVWDPANSKHYDFTDFASREIIRKGKPYPISLNLEAIC